MYEHSLDVVLLGMCLEKYRPSPALIYRGRNGNPEKESDGTKAHSYLVTETRALISLSDSASRIHASHPAMDLWDCHRPCPFHGDGFDGPVRDPARFTEMALMLTISSEMS